MDDAPAWARAFSEPAGPAQARGDAPEWARAFGATPDRPAEIDQGAAGQDSGRWDAWSRWITGPFASEPRPMRPEAEPAPPEQGLGEGAWRAARGAAQSMPERTTGDVTAGIGAAFNSRSGATAALQRAEELNRALDADPNQRVDARYDPLGLAGQPPERRAALLDDLRRRVADPRQTWGERRIAVGHALSEDAERQAATEFPVSRENQQRFWVQAARAAVDLPKYIAAGMIHPSVLGALMQTEGYGAGYREAQRKGADAATAEKYALAHALFELVGEGVPVARGVNRLIASVPAARRGQVRQVLMSLLAQTAEQGAGEAFTQAGQNLAARGTFDPERDPTKDVAQAAGIGAALGAGMHAPGAAWAGYRAATSPQPAVPGAAETVDAVGRATEQTAQQDPAERGARQAQQMVEAAAALGQPDPTQPRITAPPGLAEGEGFTTRPVGHPAPPVPYMDAVNLARSIEGDGLTPAARVARAAQRAAGSRQPIAWAALTPDQQRAAYLELQGMAGGTATEPGSAAAPPPAAPPSPMGPMPSEAAPAPEQPAAPPEMGTAPIPVPDSPPTPETPDAATPQGGALVPYTDALSLARPLNAASPVREVAQTIQRLFGQPVTWPNLNPEQRAAVMQDLTQRQQQSAPQEPAPAPAPKPAPTADELGAMFDSVAGEEDRRAAVETARAQKPPPRPRVEPSPEVRNNPESPAAWEWQRDTSRERAAALRAEAEELRRARDLVFDRILAGSRRRDTEIPQEAAGVAARYRDRTALDRAVAQRERDATMLEGRSKVAQRALAFMEEGREAPFKRRYAKPEDNQPAQGPPPKAPQRLIDYLRAHGGVNDRDGHLRAMGADRIPGLINNRTPTTRNAGERAGMAVDDAISALLDGQFSLDMRGRGEADKAERNPHDAFYAAIREELHGRRQGRHGDEADFAAQMHAWRAEDENLRQIAEDLGMEPDEVAALSRGQVADLMAERMSAAELQRMVREALEDAEAAMQEAAEAREAEIGDAWEADPATVYRPGEPWSLDDHEQGAPVGPDDAGSATPPGGADQAQRAVEAQPGAESGGEGSSAASDSERGQGAARPGSPDGEAAGPADGPEAGGLTQPAAATSWPPPIDEDRLAALVQEGDDPFGGEERDDQAEQSLADESAAELAGRLSYAAEGLAHVQKGKKGWDAARADGTIRRMADEWGGLLEQIADIWGTGGAEQFRDRALEIARGGASSPELLDEAFQRIAAELAERGMPRDREAPPIPDELRARALKAGLTEDEIDASMVSSPGRSALEAEIIRRESAEKPKSPAGGGKDLLGKPEEPSKAEGPATPQPDLGAGFEASSKQAIQARQDDPRGLRGKVPQKGTEDFGLFDSGTKQTGLDLSPPPAAPQPDQPKVWDDAAATAGREAFERSGLNQDKAHRLIYGRGFFHGVTGAEFEGGTGARRAADRGVYLRGLEDGAKWAKRERPESPWAMRPKAEKTAREQLDALRQRINTTAGEVSKPLHDIIDQAEKIARAKEPGRGQFFGRGATTWTKRQEGWFQEALDRRSAPQLASFKAALARFDRLMAEQEAQAKRLGINEPWKPDSWDTRGLHEARRLLDEMGVTAEEKPQEADDEASAKPATPDLSAVFDEVADQEDAKAGGNVKKAAAALEAIMKRGKPLASGRRDTTGEGPADEYAEVLPHLRAAVQDFPEAWGDPRELIRKTYTALVAAVSDDGRAQFREWVKPHIVRFTGDVLAGRETLVKPPASAEPAVAPSTEPTAPASTVTPDAQAKLAARLARMLMRRDRLTSDDLLRMAAAEYGGTAAEGAFDRKDAYDALELAVNLAVRDSDPWRMPTRRSLEHLAPGVIESLAQLKASLPTQTVRTREQVEFQQFSTPPDYAALAAFAAGLRPGDVVLEPSAGTGSLVASAMAPGVQVVANEIAPRRIDALRTLLGDRGRVTTEDAEQIHRILPGRGVQPSVVMMNPPFSRAGHRTGNAVDTQVGANHIRAALKMLPEGGRLIAIVGRGMAMDAPAFRNFWRDMLRDNLVRANIPISGQVYAKYGTGFGTRLLVIDKGRPAAAISRPVAPPDTGPRRGNGQNDGLTLDQALELLKEVRDARPDARQEASAGAPAEQPRGESGSPPVADRAEGAAGSVPPASGDAAAPGAGGGRSGARGAGSGGRGASAGARPPAGRRSGKGDDLAAGQPEPAESEGSRGDAGDQPRPSADGARSDGRAAGDGARQADGGGNQPAGLEPSTPTEEDPAPQDDPEAEGAVYEAYRPQRLTIAGAKPHPGALVQSAAMGSVAPPAIAYQPNLGNRVIADGLLSDAQIETVAYAGQAHQAMLEGARNEDARRRGFFIGDGTGVGKGRQISGIILDNWNRGRTKAVWISEKASLLSDAKRDWSGLGQDPNLIFSQAKTDPEGKVPAARGILFTTYDTLKGGLKNATAAATGAMPIGSTVRHSFDGRAGVTTGVPTKGRNPTVKVRWNGEKKGEDVSLGSVEMTKRADARKTRAEQIAEWVGKDFDGVIAFDEAHNMANAVSTKGKRGFKPVAEKALAGVELQRLLPKARVVYVSATGATEVANLAYADRLGLWGPGTAFETRSKFLSEIEAGGLAAMELVARDLKAMGLYLARNLSFDGLEYTRLDHELTPEQREVYDALANAWQAILRNINAALEATNADKSKNAASAAKSTFWGAQQRFFMQVISSMKMPSVIRAIEEDVKAGRSPVIQLTQTNEADTERAAAKLTEEDTLEDLDITPREQVIEMLKRSFPVQVYEVRTDPETGAKFSVPVVDSDGNPVLDPEAVAMRDALIRDVARIRIPDGPLDQILNHFGIDKVAEVTGRTRRFVYDIDALTGERKRVEQRRSRAVAEGDAEAFNTGKKPILVFSDAGGTGRSYHASNQFASRDRRRVHYVLQPGWRADRAVQGLGRTHRTDQASAPIVRLTATNLGGERRFISTIARRLSQLGALTKGQRQAGDSGVFAASDNLESTPAQEALREFWTAIQGGRGPMSMEEVENKLGLALQQKEGGFKKELPPIEQFLNRVMVLPVDEQNRVFEHFTDLVQRRAEAAAALGTIDVGLETITAEKIRKAEERVVSKHPETGAETSYVRLIRADRTVVRSFEDAQRDSFHGRFIEFAKSPTGKVYALRDGPQRTDRDGKVHHYFDLRGVLSQRYVPHDSVRWGFQRGRQGWERISREDAKKLWDAETAAAPEFIETPIHMMTGALLPVWDRLRGSGIRVMRATTTEGKRERFLGRILPPQAVQPTLQKFGIDIAAEALPKTPEAMADALKSGQQLTLANGWTLKPVRVAGDQRFELVGPQSPAEAAAMRDLGIQEEMISYRARYFVPTGAGAAPVLEKLTARRPVTHQTKAGAPVRKPEEEAGDTEADLLSARRDQPPAGPQAAKSDASPDRRLADLLRVWASQMGLPENLAIELASRIGGADGTYRDGLVRFALDTDPKHAGSRVFHEFVHAMMDERFSPLSAADRGVIEDAARRWLKAPFDPKALRPGAKVAPKEAQGFKTNRDYLGWLNQSQDDGRLLQEAAAHLGERYLARAIIPRSPLARVFERMIAWAKAMGRAFRGMGWRTADDVFAGILRGDHARPGAADALKAARDAVPARTMPVKAPPMPDKPSSMPDKAAATPSNAANTRGFTTAKGSTYVLHPDGTTTRTKAARPEHPGDQGEKARSARTVYVAAPDVQRFATPSGDWRIVQHKDGTWSLATHNQDGRWGTAPSSRNIRVQAEPSIGTHPLEVWDGEPGPAGSIMFRKMHMGNAVRALTESSVKAKPGGTRQNAEPGSQATEKADVTSRNVAAPRDRTASGIRGIAETTPDAYFSGRRDTAQSPAGDGGLASFRADMEEARQGLSRAKTEFIAGLTEVAPMAGGSARGRVWASRFANALRALQYRYGSIDRELQRRFTPEQRRRMAEAIDAQSVFEQVLARDLQQLPAEQREAHAAQARAEFDAGAEGIASLSDREREVAEELDRLARQAWERMRARGIVAAGSEGLPSYMPRMFVRIVDGRIEDLPTGGRESGMDWMERGRNLTTLGPKRRRHLRAEESLEAARALFGDNTELISDVRALVQALARNERAIAGSDLVTALKRVGQQSGSPIVRQGELPVGERQGWFTISHPSLTRLVPLRREVRGSGTPRQGDMLGREEAETGRWERVRDANGRTVMTREQLWLPEEFREPLEAVLSAPSGRIVKALMKLKAGVMHLIMFSPAIHLMVEAGRTLPIMPSVLWLRPFFIGDALLQDDAAMQRAIRDGLAPIARGWSVDPNTVAEESAMAPVREGTIGRLVQGFAERRRAIGRVLSAPANKLGAERLGRWLEDVWNHPHQTLLWDNILRLQAGIYREMRERYIAKGFPPEAAGQMAAHLANRYAGALPPETMARWANVASNLALFSRSFTLGNVAVMKDALTGAPKYVIDSIAAAVNDQAIGDRARVELRKKAASAFAIDVGIFLALSALMQSAISLMAGADLDDEAQGYLRRFQETASHLSRHPQDVAIPALGGAAIGARAGGWPGAIIGAIVGASWPTLAHTIPNHENEPGKQERIFAGLDSEGRGIYVRTPLGKVGEEFAGYLTNTRQIIVNKLSPQLRPLIELALNRDSLGRTIIRPDAEGGGDRMANLGRAVWHIAQQQVPADVLRGAYGAVTGDHRGDRTVEAMKVLGPVTGAFTVSRGFPGGPAEGVRHQSMERLKLDRQEAMPEVRRLIREGRIEEARERMRQAGMLPRDIAWQLRAAQAPASREAASMRRFLQTANEEEKARLRHVTGRPERHADGGIAGAAAPAAPSHTPLDTILRAVDAALPGQNSTIAPAATGIAAYSGDDADPAVRGMRQAQAMWAASIQHPALFRA